MDTKQIDTTLIELVKAEPFLRRISEHDLPAKLRYHVAKLGRLVAAETKIFEEQQRDLFAKLSIERDARNPQELQQFGPTVREVPPGAREKFEAELRAVGVVLVSIPWGTLRSVDLPQAKASDLIGLGPLVELVEPEDTP
jgi:hypothetical protein